MADEVLLHRSLPLGVETGIGFTSAGGAYRGLAIRPMDLQVPLLLNVRIRLGRRLDLIPAAGAWYAVGLGGKIRYQKSKMSYDHEQRKIYRIFYCPTCKQKIRAPKGKGKIQITCPKCKTEFIRRTKRRQGYVWIYQRESQGIIQRG